VQQKATGLGTAHGRPRARLTQQRRQRVGVVGRHPLRERSERLHPGPRGRCPVELRATPEDHGPALGRESSPGLGEQSRLPGARFAGDEHGAADASGGRGDAVQGVEFGFPADEDLRVGVRTVTGGDY